MAAIKRYGLLLTASNILLPIACLIFASGFFPYKPFLGGLATYQKHAYGEPPTAPFDKIVFMVVDALRSDFVFSRNSGFQFTQELIRHGSALPFTAHATAPTVTMPRVKAITTGSVPSFLDMILNFAESDTSSSLANQDNWLSQMKAKGDGKLVMYGDETWLKLFSDTFDRADGTSSFFVSDFTEVDNNVTRHVPDELERDDWSVMVMHYLGMDHIGHKAGPRSLNMIPKQREMDGIVRTIYEAIETKPALQSTLLVLCGDHGMNDGGNHGGSAPGETSPALVFVSPKFSTVSRGIECPTHTKRDFEYYDLVEQSDIAPTLAGLLGFPIPLNNLGVFIPQLLTLWPREIDKIQLLVQNALQMLEIVKATFPHPLYEDSAAHVDCTGTSSSTDTLACAWSAVINNTIKKHDPFQAPQTEIDALNHFCKTTQELLSSTASNYKVSNLYGGIALALIALLLSLFPPGDAWKHPSSAKTPSFVLISGAYAVMMFASSYVEEEQQFWYWTASGWVSLQYLFKKPLRLRSKGLQTVISLLVTLRVARRWNQSGQKYAGAADIAGALHGQLSPFLWALVLATYLDIGIEISNQSFDRIGGKNTRIPTAMLTALSVIFKIAFVFNDDPELLNGMSGVFAWCKDLDIVVAGRLVFVGIAVSLAWIIFARTVRGMGRTGNASLFASINPVISLLLVNQTRIQNIPLFLLFNFQLKQMKNLSQNRIGVTITTLIFAHVSFFAMGNTNAISSLDLSNAYNGISSYSPIPVAFLLYVSNWAGPIYWSLAGLLLVLQTTEEGEEADVKLPNDTATTFPTTVTTAPTAQPSRTLSAYYTHTNRLTTFVAVQVLAVMVACAILRTHLFVWTVFSPKYLYMVAWMGAWHLGGNVLVGGILAATVEAGY